ncbi:universal stress protein PHOS34-like [Macadamia integrifolia]|uniref:universal stress protein PHOS34-like n=1 Tax=Macadamia integrifolia TaxID=60698 RepID=UPI001C4F40F7|nr:universal stress protein PHOS34-like [Macadamia integrifolia]
MAKARTIGVAMDYSPTSKAALRWAIDNLVVQGEDQLILIHVRSAKSDNDQKKKLWGENGSPSIPLEELKVTTVSKQYGLNPDAEVLDLLDTVSRTKGAKVICKVYWGDPRERLCDAVEDLKLDSLVVGSRGLGALKRSVFLLKYCMQVPQMNLECE